MLFSWNDNVSANIDNHIIILSENKNELLGVILDSKLSFNLYVNEHTSIHQTKSACKIKLSHINSYQITNIKFINLLYLNLYEVSSLQFKKSLRPPQ